MARIVCLGEAMVELSGSGPAAGWNVGFGGDTLNTAVHLARFGHDVAYMTALGKDAFSAGLCKAWAAEGIDCGLVLRHPTRQSGLYAITTDLSGERSFTYWRETSAARALFELETVSEAMDVAETADLLCFSLISLAILPAAGRQQLLRLAGRVRDHGGIVAFDGNYRPRLWESVEAAANMRDKAIAFADIGLPTFEDEAQLDGAASPQAVAAHWQRLGCGEVLVKLGAQGCLLPDGSACPVPSTLSPVDTSGAGDAFNGGYLAARMQGVPVAQAALVGHRLAGWNVMRPGAIPAVDEEAPYAT
ncbi:sugar kinase [Novosphingobium guangzhouense]|uniref:2-dehydro-3-deoxygluconokinase n=1 Tax=Novosphingobium guangzhouense TaxID=1850347 RepID=A0A2K2FXF8_9SPHN|nr:sugar kinase [Novosphingobium guangzhouense]PNU03452.1 2-dehydro-3-deoxygluconokinase [Novosphingobium guangzhouense]